MMVFLKQLPVHVRHRFSVYFKQLQSRLIFWLKTPATSTKVKHKRRAVLALMYALIFLTALGVRLLHWQDSNLELLESDTIQNNLGVLYWEEAQRILDEGRLLYPEKPDPNDLRAIIHPPGNSLLMAASLKLFGAAEKPVRLTHILISLLSAVMVCLIAMELFNFGVGLIAGLLVSLSPHLSYYSIWLSPDSTAVFPLLLSLFFLIRTAKQPNLPATLVAGFMLGLSCWFRANALLLVLFLSVSLFFMLKKPSGRRYALAFAMTTLLVIAPLVIRNWLVYQRFIPISLGSGVTLIEGIANYDHDNRFDMPHMDAEVGPKEAEWYERPEYAQGLWHPDGIERERLRVRRGLQVIREHPLWFGSVMLRRMGFMLRYNDFQKQEIPYNTTIAPVISAAPTFAHPFLLSDTSLSPQVTLSAPQLAEQVKPLATAGNVAIRDNQLELLCDSSAQREQFEIASLAVHPNSDYILAINLQGDNGEAVIKVNTADAGITLALKDVPRRQQPKRKNNLKPVRPEADESQQAELDMIKLAFSSGDYQEVRVILANNNRDTSANPLIKMEKVEVFELGQTPGQWTRVPRALVRGVQKNLFKTDVMRGLIVLGILILIAGRQYRALWMLLVVPIYYLLLQSALHTEYRYILAIHYFLFIVAAVTLYCVVMSIFTLTKQVHNYFRPSK